MSMGFASRNLCANATATWHSAAFSKVRIALTAFAATALASLACAAEFKFASVISDHAVLQREVEAPVWGFAETGVVVRVSLFKEGETKPLAERTATTDATGRWRIKFPAMPAGGPYSLHAELVDCSRAQSATGSRQSTAIDKNRISISDVLFGDVWFGCGQSNMDYTFDGY